MIRAGELKSGQVIMHQPRQSFYKVMYKCKLKTESGWVDVIAYQQHYRFGSIWVPGPEYTIYVRPVEMFDEDWKLITNF